jgi:2-phospho-L-lactate guanylyltransferase
VATAAILPIKRFDRAKQRLGTAITAGSRRALAAAMFADVVAALRHSSLVETVVLVSSEPAAADLVSEPEVTLIADRSERGQSQATLAGLARVSALGYERALLVAGDCPLIDPLEVDSLIANAALSKLEVAIVPDRHQVGTNALLLDPMGSFQPQFGPDSLALHSQQARRRGLSWSVERVPSLELDVDTGEDLGELIRVLDRFRGRAPRTQGVLRQIGRSLQPPPIPA